MSAFEPHSNAYNAAGGTHLAGGLHHHDKHHHTGAPEISDRNAPYNATGDTHATDEFLQHDQHHNTGVSGITDRNTQYNATGGMGAADDFQQYDKHHHHTGVPGFTDHNAPHNTTGGTHLTDKLHHHDKHHDKHHHHHTIVPENTSDTNQCIEFLSAIKRVEVVSNVPANRSTSKEVVTDKVKDVYGDTNYTINVVLADTNNNTGGSNFQIQRSFKEFKELQHVAERWSKKHERKGCTYCPFFESSDLPGMLSRMTASKDHLEGELQDFLYRYIANARRPRPTETECQGFDHIPSVLTRFITKDLSSAYTGAQQETMSTAMGKNTVAHGAAGNYGMAHGVTGKHDMVHGEAGPTEYRP